MSNTAKDRFLDVVVLPAGMIDISSCAMQHEVIFCIVCKQFDCYSYCAERVCIRKNIDVQLSLNRWIHLQEQFATALHLAGPGVLLGLVTQYCVVAALLGRQLEYPGGHSKSFPAKACSKEIVDVKQFNDKYCIHVQNAIQTDHIMRPS